jgi:aldehyde dehydrogenase (NAD+)
MASNHHQQFYIDGVWVDPVGTSTHNVVNPATELVVTTVALGNVDDADQAVSAARRAFPSFSMTTRDERLDLLDAIIAAYQQRSRDLEDAVTTEMGAPVTLARSAHVPAGLGQFLQARKALATFVFEARDNTTAILHEPAGVCTLITPWNWPLLLISAKVAPALAAGCTMVLKPSEFAPLSALVLTEILETAGVPAGVFNLVNGTGPVVGARLASHPDVDMVSFTGSTRAGVEVAQLAAPTVKRVHQELGGKSANILLPDADLSAAVTKAVGDVCENSGQSCDVGSRVLVPRDRLAEAESLAAAAAAAIVVGSPDEEGTDVGPVASRPQYEKVQRLLDEAVADGARVIAGGPGRPDGVEVGYYVRPTVLSGVTNQMNIAREEIFGPVLTLIPYDDEAHAVQIANDTPYGLSGYVSSPDLEKARSIARQIRTGMMHVNGASLDGRSPFGGFKSSGNGREYGEYGLRDFMEVKSVFGYYPLNVPVD